MGFGGRGGGEREGGRARREERRGGEGRRERDGGRKEREGEREGRRRAERDRVGKSKEELVYLFLSSVRESRGWEMTFSTPPLERVPHRIALNTRNVGGAGGGPVLAVVLGTLPWHPLVIATVT